MPNGDGLTASDVKFSYDRIKKNRTTRTARATLLANVESVDPRGDGAAVVFKDSVPFDVTLKQVMSSPAGPIVDEDTFDADGRPPTPTPSSPRRPLPARTR